MEDEFKHLVRISRKDVDGNKTIEHALTDIKGIGLSLSKTMCRVLDLDLNSKIGYIADEDVAKIEDYHSHNTRRLDVEGMKELLMKLRFIREDLGYLPKSKPREIRSE